MLRVINDKGENGWLEIPIDQLVPGDIIKWRREYDPGRLTYLAGAGSVRRWRR
ncbi:hypothetical protein ACNKHV_26660 [Shigella flexneri]